MIKQTQITVSGCNIWKRQIIACSSTRFAFASTMAIHVYDLTHFQLIKLLTATDTNITAIAWQPRQEKYLAQATFAKQFAVWDLDSEKVKFQLNLPSHATQIEWNRCNLDEIYLLLMNNELKRVDLTSQKVQDITINFGSRVTPNIVKINPRVDDIVSFGLSNGYLLFYSQKLKQSYSLAGVGQKDRKEETKEELELASIKDISWDPYEENLLASFGGGVFMVGFQGLSTKTQITQVFKVDGLKISSLFWADDKSGNFVSSNESFGALTIWNAASEAPQKTIKLGCAGVHSMLPIVGQQRVVTAHKDGAISVFNVSTSRTEFSTESGHSETIFDLDYHPNEPNLLASCSYDGTIRVWDTSQNKLIAINDTNRQKQQAQFDKRIIYSCSWHPQLTKIALVTVNGYLMIYDALIGKCLASICPYPGQPSYKVAWNKRDPKYILMTSSQNAVFIIGVMDQPKCTQLTVQHQFSMPAPVYGGAWSCKDDHTFAVGCKDQRVRLYDIYHDKPKRIFEGHSERVYNVVFNPTMTNLLASGSDDKSIRVWDVNSESNSAICVLGGGSASSHTSNVRAIAFAPDIVWCLLSGSWDGTIKIWDIRSGACMLTLTDHNSDVYGISFQERRPFVFASCSRDTTIRHFNFDGLVQQLKLQLLCAETLDHSEVLVNPQSAFAQRGKYMLCSANSHKLISQLKQEQDHTLRELMIYDYLHQLEGQVELISMIKELLGCQMKDKQDMKTSHSGSLIHKTIEKAKFLRSASGMQLLNSKFSNKKECLEETARMYLSCGRIKDYCEVQFEIGNYAKAMSFAPAVSIEYWQELADRRAALTKGEQAICASIIANRIDKATEQLEEQQDIEDAKLVRVLQIKGVFTGVGERIQTKAKMEQNQCDFQQADQDLSRIIKEESSTYFSQGKCLLAAASYLSINEFRLCVQTLVRGNELYLAYIIAKRFCKEALAETAMLLAERAEKYFCSDIVIELVSKYCPSQTALVRRRLMNAGLLKNVIQPEIQKTELSLHDLLVQNKLQEACLFTDQVMSSYYKKPRHDCKEFFIVADMIQQVSLIKVQREVKQATLFFCAFTGLFKAMHYGFFDVIVQLRDYFERVGGPDPEIGVFVNLAIYEYRLERMLDMSGPMEPPSAEMKQRFDCFKQGCVEYMAQTSHLFAEQGDYSIQIPGVQLKGESVSAWSDRVIKGAMFTFEDGKTRVSVEEAQMWAACCRHSWVGNGNRINPW